MKPTKRNIASVIRWSSSRYNVLKKAHVVDRAHRILTAGEGRAEFRTGSYSERGHLGGWSYIVDGGSRTITRRGGASEEVVKFSA